MTKVKTDSFNRSQEKLQVIKDANKKKKEKHQDSVLTFRSNYQKKSFIYFILNLF